MDNLKKRWKIFGNIIFDPWTIVLLFITILLLFYSSSNEISELKVILSTLSSLSSAILGSRIITIWVNETEGRILLTRGKTAIRNLILLLKNVHLLEGRIKTYLLRHKSQKLSKSELQTYFEETIEKCYVIEEEAVNSIEDWKDIIPEADVKTKIGLITDLKIQLAEKQEEKDELIKLRKIRSQSDEEKKQLKAKIEEMNISISNLKSELAQQTFKDESVIGGITLPSGTLYSGELYGNRVGSTLIQGNIPILSTDQEWYNEPFVSVHKNQEYENIKENDNEIKRKKKTDKSEKKS